MSAIRKLSLAVFWIAQMAMMAWAGPFSDAETQIRLAYADYRTALFQTNQKDKAATQSALRSFQTKWSALSNAWKVSPPPQYADDPKLFETLDAVGRIAHEATTAAEQGELAKSHDTLEAIRDQLAALRARNGVISFSDRMNAYHAAMEHVVDLAQMTPSAALEHAAILAYLTKDIATNRPSSIDTTAFDLALKALEASVVAFQEAARSGDKTAIDTARKGLKPPYSRLFLRFG